MRRYGMNQATEFSKKQISVIYCKAKAGELKVEKWVMSEFYDLADFYGVDWNGSITTLEQRILHILESVFSGDLEKAQDQIDFFTKSLFKDLSIKRMNSVDRALVA